MSGSLVGTRKLTIVAAAAILVLAAWLRLWRLDLIEFKTDEGIVLRLAEDWVRLGHFPLVGMPSSVDVPLPPWFIYVVAPAVALSRDPRVATGLIGLINVAAVGGVVVLGWRLFSGLSGLVAGLVLAADPWSVFYSRKLWPNDVLAPLAVLLFLAVDLGTVGRNYAWAAAALPIVAIGVQVHFVFALLAPLALAPLVVLAIRRKWRMLALSVFLAALSAVPYLVHQVQTDFADTRVLQNLATSTPVVDADGPAWVMSWATSWDTWNLEFVHLDRLLPGRVSAAAADLQTGLVALGGAIALITAVGLSGSGQSSRFRSIAVCLWLVLPAVLTIRHTLELGERYFPFVAPAGALLMGAAVWWLGARAGTVGKALSGLALVSVAVLAGVHVFMVVRMLDYVERQYNDTYGLPLIVSEAVAHDVVSFAARTGTRAAAVEERLGPESGAMAYLIRLYVPTVELAGIGQVGLGASIAADGDAKPGSVAQSLSAAQYPPLRYADGVRVDEAATSARWMPGQRARLAVTWVGSATSAPVVWEVSIYDVAGTSLGNQVSPSHAPDGATMLSVFSLPTETGFQPEPLVFGLRRLGAQEVEEWRSAPVEAVRH